MFDDTSIQSTVEALILASPEPLQAERIVSVIGSLTASRVNKAVNELNQRYSNAGTSFRIREIAGGYQFYIIADFVGYVEEMFSRRRKLRLTRAALETAAIIAYRQPVTKNEIEQIRGVASDGVINTLLEKNMITITGRATTVGKPLEYGTNDEFLKFFGLNSMSDLPKMEEIEELIASVEKKNQTELTLPDLANEEASFSDVKVAAGETSDELRITRVVPEVVPIRRLILHRPGESTEVETHSEETKDTNELPAQAVNSGPVDAKPV